LLKHRSELIDALRERRLGGVRIRFGHQQPQAVLGMCEMVPERAIGSPGPYLRPKRLDQVRQLIGVFGMKGVENAGLKIPALLRMGQSHCEAEQHR
jgi:hypothetical protein